MSTAVKVIVVTAFVALAAGCADLKPLEGDVASLKNQAAQLQSDVDQLKRGASTAQQAISDAQRNAQAASAKADQALAAAQTADQKIAETNEQMDRMFKRTVSK
jgi:chromosome segregation ATPase